MSKRHGVSVVSRFCAAALLLVAPAIAGATLVPSGQPSWVTRYYRFETQSGGPVSPGQTLTQADDSSGNSRTGLGQDAVSYTVSPFAGMMPASGLTNTRALQIGRGHGNSEVSGVYLDPAGQPILASTFTVEAFFRLTSGDYPTGDDKAIFRVRSRQGGWGTFALGLGLQNLNGGGGTDDLRVHLADETAGITLFDLLINKTYHVAVTYDGAALNMYLDGVLRGSSPLVGFTGSGTMPAAIGNDPQGPAKSAFQGQIDEVRISNVALQPSQFLNVVPEPMSLGLLPLAGVALSRRRPRA